MKNCNGCIHYVEKDGLCQKHTTRSSWGGIIKPHVVSKDDTCGAYNADWKHCANCGKEIAGIPQIYAFRKDRQINFCSGDCKNKKLQIQNLQEIDRTIENLMWGHFQEDERCKPFQVEPNKKGEL